MGMMGEYFVLGADIGAALHKPRRAECRGFAYSYGMLDEAAHTDPDTAW